jgi:hypothetical protein
MVAARSFSLLHVAIKVIAIISGFAVLFEMHSALIVEPEGGSS